MMSQTFEHAGSDRQKTDGPPALVGEAQFMPQADRKLGPPKAPQSQVNLFLLLLDTSKGFYIQPLGTNISFLLK